VSLDPRPLVESWVAAFNAADVERLAAFYAEDAINHQVAESPVVGRDAIRAMFAAGFAACTASRCRPASYFTASRAAKPRRNA
jgi:uncharacterized protein (TIGR02246 family)